MSKPSTASSSFNRAGTRFGKYQYVYPNIGRRSGGFSVGVNLTPGGACNFNCVYCSVAREACAWSPPADLALLRAELLEILKMSEGRLWRIPPFHRVPRERRKLKTFALSGEGEPTLSPVFAGACQWVAAARDSLATPGVKIILFTNGTLLSRPQVQAGLARLDSARDEIWIKLDAGSPQYYGDISRSNISLEQILWNIATTGRTWPVVLQSMFVNFRGENISSGEFRDYCERVKWLLDQGCRLRRVQFYTPTRPSALSNVAVLPRETLDRLAEKFRAAVPGVACEVFA